MLAGTAEVNCVALTNGVASGEPFHSTVAPGTNLAPLTVNVNAGTPSVAALGVRLVRVAAGGLIVNSAWVEAIPSPLGRVMVTPPANPNTLDGTDTRPCGCLSTAV